MREKILILGGSGTIGSSIFRWLARKREFDVYGTYFTSNAQRHENMMHLDVGVPKQLSKILEEIRPDIIISALRGSFEKQLALHQLAAEYLAHSYGKMLYFSTVNVFDGNLERTHYESDICRAESDYGKFKVDCENVIRNIMENQVAVLRIPFVWGRHSLRLDEIKNGCRTGLLEIYDGLISNHAADLQIAEYVEWIIREKKEGIFHIGTEDVIEYGDFISRLIKELGEKQPEFVLSSSPGVMAVLSRRMDIPSHLKWDTEKLIAYLCGKGDFQKRA